MKDDNHTEIAPCNLISYHRCKGHANSQLQHLERYNSHAITTYLERYSHIKPPNRFINMIMHKHFGMFIQILINISLFSKWLVDLLLFVFLFPLKCHRSTKMMKTYTRACFNILAIDGNYYIDY